jgi:hypothetical protein
MLLRRGDVRRNGSGPDRDDGYDDYADAESPSRLVKTGTICAVLLGAMLLASIGIIVWSRTSAHSPTHHTAGPVTSVPATGQVPAPPTSTATDTPVLPTPGQVTWLQVGLGALPFSGTAGPTAIHAGVPSGFAHTQPGSVMAAIQILGRLSWSAQTRASMHAVATTCTTPSAEAVKAVTYGPPSDPSVIPAVAGFQIVTYSPTQAVVNLALRFNGAVRVVPATMQWTGGDWKLAGAPGPLTDTSWADVGDLTGYVLFSGQPTKEGD